MVNNIKVTNFGSKSVYVGTVTASFPYKANELVLKAINRGFPLYSVDHLNETALFAAMCKNVYTKLAERTQDVIKNKFIEMKAHANASDCTISVTCAANRTAVKRIAKLMVSAMDPSKLFPLYSQKIKTLGESPSRECFNHCADKLYKAVKSSLDIVITGKVFLSSDEIKYVHDKVKEEVDAFSAIEGDKKAMTVKSTPDAINMPSVKIPQGLMGLLIKDYIKSQLRVWVHYGGDKLYIRATESKVEKLSDDEKMEKYSTKVAAVLKKHYQGYINIAAKRAYGSVSALVTDAGKEMSAKSIMTALKAALK